LWRLPPAVDGLARHPWLVVVEGLCLLLAGLGVWSLLLSGPPAPGVTPSYPWRMAVAAVVMWSTWVFAYLVGLSHVAWYPVYTRTSGLSTNADQQLATGVLWAGAGLAFGPVVFWCLWQWLAPERTGPV
jgi:cytochrome c oxidase assembly factor CtaG